MILSIYAHMYELYNTTNFPFCIKLRRVTFLTRVEMWITMNERYYVNVLWKRSNNFLFISITKGNRGEEDGKKAQVYF